MNDSMDAIYLGRQTLTNNDLAIQGKWQNRDVHGRRHGNPEEQAPNLPEGKDQGRILKGSGI